MSLRAATLMYKLGNRSYSSSTTKTSLKTALSSPYIRSPKHRSSPTQRIMTTSAASNEAPASYCFDRRERATNDRLIFTPPSSSSPIPIICIPSDDNYTSWLSHQSSTNKELTNWLQTTNFKGKDGDIALIPHPTTHDLQSVVVSIKDQTDIWSYASLPDKLPGSNTYTFVDNNNSTTTAITSDPQAAYIATLGWVLGTYDYTRYKSNNKKDTTSVQQQSSRGAVLQCPSIILDNEDYLSLLKATYEGIYLTRDMITTPAEDMCPQHIAAEAVALAKYHKASFINVIVGDDLLKQNYPAIHTVGRASVNAPRLVDFEWTHSSSSSSSDSLPLVTLVGKGVSFDTGGLDLKPANAMKLMKKDMGGAALVLGLAHAIMSVNAKVKLRVLVPTVENSVSGNAFRPLDVLNTRAGITVENGNTDAEGRLILSDALTEAASQSPDLLIDAATLTGAARVALGTELPALFCDTDSVANELIQIGEKTGDGFWRLPLHKPYRKMLDSKVADIASCGDAPYGGAITAALFLQEFVKGAKSWVHIDTMGYNLGSKAGRPEGGEAFGLRTLCEYIIDKYGR